MKPTISAILIMGFILIYFLLVNIYSILFRITGVTKEKARFQVISLLTGAGYTTSESEIITDDIVRRKIAKAAMITGYAFSVIIVTLIINLLVSLKGDEQAHTFEIILIAFGIFIVSIFIFKIPFIKNTFERLIEKISSLFLTRGKEDNVITTLDNYGKDAIVEIYIRNLPDVLKGQSLIEAKIKDRYNLNILMLKRKNKILEVTKDTMIQIKDSIVVFGNYHTIKELFHFRKSELALESAPQKVVKNTIALIDNYHSDAMVEVTINKVPSLLKESPLIESGLRENYGINVMMLTHNGNVIKIDKDTFIKKGQTLIVFGPYKNIKDLFLD